MSDILDGPGGLTESTDSSLPVQDAGELANLEPTFQPTAVTLPATLMDDYSDSSLTGVPAASTPSSFASGGLGSLDTSGLLTFGENAATGLLNAFVITPQNVSTAEGAASTAASLSSAATGTIFSWLFLGLIVYLIFGFVERK
jgi:hypothetical protein